MSTSPTSAIPADTASETRMPWSNASRTCWPSAGDRVSLAMASPPKTPCFAAFAAAAGIVCRCSCAW
ncbi:MAG: hypothetical protein AUG49_07210 [Catenulispora sp. 13_1_20CM_3_70_7]|nr:MAG: hypothetical protein AUG49_07210 [Catenulispora sp. 13_1_20CM_3_70_7]